MDGKNKRSGYVVVVMRNNAPIAFINRIPEGDDADAVDISVSPDSSYGEIEEALSVASHALGFLIWKEGGPLPLPRGYLGPARSDDTPF